MSWFTDAESVMLWGSPFTRFPLREETFFIDTEWEEIASRVARDDDLAVGLHQRVPVILGSRSEVERVVAYHRDHDAG